MRRLGVFGSLFRQSIQFRLTCYFIVILLPLIAFSLFANDRSQRILEQELGERTLSAMGSTLEYIDLTMGGVKSLSTLLSTDRSLTLLLNHDDGEHLSTDTLLDFSRVMDVISNIAAVNPSLSAVTVYHGNTGRLLSSRIGSLQRPRAAEEQWYRDVMRSNGSYILYLPDRHEAELMGWADPVYNESQVMLMQRMDLYSREKGNNVLMLSVPKSKLLGYLTSLVPSAGSHVYLFDNNGQLIVTNASAKGGKTWDNRSGRSPTELEMLDSDPSNMVLRVDSPTSGWALLLEQPEREIYKKSRPLQYFSYGMIFISCLLAVWISWVVYSGIASPISSLVEGMKLLRIGKLDTRLTNKRQDELGYLTDAFNQTIEQQRHLIRDIYEQQLLLTKTELKFLQSQINPHFLYNTLNSIYWSAKNYNADEISEMVLNLSKFLRLSLSKGREAFTVEETFSHLGYYIRVQQLRFAGQFTVRYEADPDSRGLYMLKLIQQPLVENAILHGLEKKKLDGELLIAAERRGDRLILTVSDNGKGISEEKMGRIRVALAGCGGGEIHAAKDRSDEFFGLRNVKSRIRLYYGDSAEFVIDSQEGVGTIVRIDLPAERCRSEWEGGESHESDDRRR